MTDRSIVSATARTAALAVLRRVAQSYASTPLPEWEQFAASTRLSTYTGREAVPLADRVGVVVRGHVKVTSARPDCTEVVQQFMSAGDVCAPMIRPGWARRTGPPMSVARWIGTDWSVPEMEVTALNRVTMLHFDYRVVEQLAARHAAWGEVHAAYLWSYIDGLFSGIQDMRDKDVTVRYRAIARRGLVGVATQREIASYLNVTEEALSRIVRRLRQGGSA